MANVGPIRRKSAYMLRKGISVVINSKRYVVETIIDDSENADGVIITMSDGTVFKRSRRAKINLI